MTLVVGTGVPAPVPATHVLVIGVGRYPHLNGGDGERLDVTWGMGQLTSPPISARALVDCLCGLNNPGAPLGSIELLLSPARTYTPPGGHPIAVESATLDHIRSAFDRWYERCDTHRENVGILYFCGHGLERQYLTLLAEDFGVRKNSPFDTAFDFDMTYLAMSSCRAGTQCFFIDACREITIEGLENPAFGGRPLREPNVNHQGPRVAPKLYATSSGERAFGEENRVSRFTSALIEALKGGAAMKEAGAQSRWIVTTDRLGQAVHRTISLQNQSLPPQEHQVVIPDGQAAGVTTLHVLNGPPAVAATVCCIPDAAHATAELYIEGKRQRYSRPTGEPGPWICTVEAGTYDVGARFNQENGFRSVVREEEWVVPPIYRCSLEVG